MCSTGDAIIEFTAPENAPHSTNCWVDKAFGFGMFLMVLIDFIIRLANSLQPNWIEAHAATPVNGDKVPREF